MFTVNKSQTTLSMIVIVLTSVAIVYIVYKVRSTEKSLPFTTPNV